MSGNNEIITITCLFGSFLFVQFCIAWFFCWLPDKVLCDAPRCSCVAALWTNQLSYKGAPWPCHSRWTAHSSGRRHQVTAIAYIAFYMHVHVHSCFVCKFLGMIKIAFLIQLQMLRMLLRSVSCSCSLIGMYVIS